MFEGIPEEVMNNMAKQIPLKALSINNVIFRCPTCKANIFSRSVCYIDETDLETRFCPNCGQRVERE